MHLSIVTTLYRSESYIQLFHEQMTRAAAAMTSDYEIIFVNDGSPDRSLHIAEQIQKKDSHVILMDLARNFGHHAAMRAGLSRASGDYVFLIDSDLEEDPQWLLLFSARLAEKKCDVVYGIQETRKGSWMEQISGKLFYFVFNHLSKIRIPANAVTARLMRRPYVEAVLQYKERELFLPAIWELAGHHQESVKVHKGYRGTTSYSLVHRLSLAVKAITSFSDRPLIAIFYFGAFISAGSLSFATYLVYLKLFKGASVMGWPSLIVSIWFLGGMIIFFMGVIGIYLARIFIEIKQRPNVLVRQTSSR